MNVTDHHQDLYNIMKFRNNSFCFNRPQLALIYVWFSLLISFYVQLAAFRKAFPAVKDVSEKHPQDRETAVELIASVVVTLDCALV